MRGSLTKLSSHEARGTLPQQLRINIPGPQLTRVFADSEKGRAHIAAYEEELAALRLALLKKQIAAKKDEVLSLEAGVHARTVVDACRRDVDAISTEVFRSHRVIPPADLEGDDEMPSEEDWEVEPAVKVVHEHLRADVGFIVGHVTNMTIGFPHAQGAA